MRYCKILKNNSGATIVLITTVFTLILAFTALVTDVGIVMVERQKFQNAVDSAVLAAAQELPNENKAIDMANKYIELNGFSSSNITVNVSNSDSINITGNKTTNLFFAKVFGFSNITTNVASCASIENIGGAFDYALFSGSKNTTLILNGSNMYVKGHSHTNKNFIANGSKITIIGVCEAVTTVRINGSQIDIKNSVPNAQYVDMPDFSQTIKVKAQQSGTFYNGNKTYNGSNINVDSPIFVDGNITVNGSGFKGKGCIVATGDIIFNGSNLSNSSNDAVCFYSINGDIIINGSGAELQGIVYAPKGSIIMNGSNQTVYGRVIGDTVTFNGSELSIISGTNELRSLPKKGVKLVK